MLSRKVHSVKLSPLKCSGCFFPVKQLQDFAETIKQETKEVQSNIQCDKNTYLYNLLKRGHVVNPLAKAYKPASHFQGMTIISQVPTLTD
ncbi:hypothetical protein FKM82_023756 [Ascaphus truei]